MGRTPEITVGWRELVALPQLGIPALKAKIDTGARTSVLHAERIETFTADGVQRVRFLVRTGRSGEPPVACEADVADRRRFTDSGGHACMRYVVETTLALGGREWPVKVSLAGRGAMRFRMLLGRTALQGRVVVDPARSYVLGAPAPEPEPGKE